METTPGDADESQVSSILICNIILIVASALAVFIRIYARIRYISVGWDDYLCIVGWVGTFVECLMCVLMTRFGYGHHVYTIHDDRKLAMFLKLDFVAELSYVVAFGAIKTSFCLFYLKIFPGKTFKILCYCVLFVIVGETFSDLFVVTFQCWPVAKAWDASGALGGRCLELLNFYYISFALRTVTDVALLTLPIPWLLRLKISSGKRVGLIIMFGLGALVTVASIIRATYLNNFSTDHTWSLVQTLNWSSAELGVGVIISCVPSFKALVTFQFPQIRSLLGLSSDRSNRGYRETYSLSGRRAGRRDGSRSWRRSHGEVGQGKEDSTERGDTEVEVEVEAARDDFKEYHVSEPSDEIRVTTDVTVN